MSAQAITTEPKPNANTNTNPKSHDAEAVRRVLSVREPAKTRDSKSPAAAAPKPQAR